MYGRKETEVTVEAEQGLPGFDVLTFQFISFKTSTRLLLAAYVPTEGGDTEYLGKLQNFCFVECGHPRKQN